MKKIFLSLVLIGGSLTVFGQSTETKAISIDDNGNVYELKSDLPSIVIPTEAFLSADGKVKTLDGVIIGVAVAQSNQGDGEGLSTAQSQLIGAGSKIVNYLF